MVFDIRMTRTLAQRVPPVAIGRTEAADVEAMGALSASQVFCSARTAGIRPSAVIAKSFAQLPPQHHPCQSSYMLCDCEDIPLGARAHTYKTRTGAWC